MAAMRSRGRVDPRVALGVRQVVPGHPVADAGLDIAPRCRVVTIFFFSAPILAHGRKR
jgi:hypothetical protein